MINFFVIIGIIFGLFYSIWGDDIFEFNLEVEENIKVARERRVKKSPLIWKIERFLHRFFGVFVGWMMLWYLLDVRLGLFSQFQNVQPDLVDVLVFILAWVGINGRLPTIAHAIQSWFKFPGT